MPSPPEPSRRRLTKLPPPDLERIRAVEPEWATVTSDEALWRVHTVDGDHSYAWHEFRHYGPVPGMRFDPQPPPPGDWTDGVMYVATDLPTCLAEVYWETRLISRDSRQVSAFFATRDLRLIDVRQSWIVKAGGAVAINGIDDKIRTQEWARALRTVHDEADGILYASSVTGKPCMALFDPPAGDAIGPAGGGDLRFSHPLDNPALDTLLLTAATQIGYLLL